MVSTKRRHRRKHRTKHTRNKHTRRHNVRKHKVRRKTKHIKRRVKRRQTRHRRHLRRRMRGGLVSLHPVPYKVGQGVPAGIGSLPIDGRNYYTLAKHNLSYPTNTSVQLGGGLSSLLPRDIVDLGRSMGAGVKGVYNDWVGQSEPISDNPNVMKQGLKKGEMKVNIVDVPTIYDKADKLAAAAV